MDFFYASRIAVHWLGRNFEFFGAPVGVIFVTDRSMEQGSWLESTPQKWRFTALDLTDVLHVFTKSWLRYPRVPAGSQTRS
jgi:hypothetical protein